MAMCDYKVCDCCGCKTYYDTSLNFSDTWVDGVYYYLPTGCGTLTSLCLDCSKDFFVVFVRREKPVTVEQKD